MDAGAMLANVGTYLAVIAALAFGVERIMDLLKTWTKGAMVKQDLSDKKEAEQEKAEEERKRRIRVWAIPVGIVLAFFAEADTFDMIGIESPYWFGLPIMGYILSGLAASRGSAFWHDIIELVGVVKETRAKGQPARQ